MFLSKETSEKLNYYFWASYRRKLIDEFQKKYKNLYTGTVLDIGGRMRGRFIKELAGRARNSRGEKRITKWISADIQKKNKPDMILDVARMDKIKSSSIDTVNAAELFEHVKEIERGLDECARVLKKGGTMLVSVPFLSPVHGDPYDFQRWTHWKWKKELKQRGLKIKKIKIMGGYFTILADMVKMPSYWWPRWLKLLVYLFHPLLDLMVKLDKTRFVRKNRSLKGYHGGYFIVAKK
ncbi:class I SAM-dependent methyltransferase [Patescibacteria group bacterium]|nr:class I SAM-dependent methyltransferase [Patescibacteria group bacterium]